jgi:protein-disulfide isomerase
MSALARRLLVACALLGLAASGAATDVHYNLIQNPDYSSFCDINATVSCKAAYLSRFGSVAGVPVAVGGVFFFAGSARTKVLIVEFADLQCPHCRKQYLAYEPILEKYAQRPQEVTLLLRHWPFDRQCNGQFSGSPHPAACEAAAAIVMARATGTAEKLTHWLFEHQDELNSATVRRAAAEIGKIPDYDAQYAKAIQEVKTDASLGSALGVSGTPAYFINGRRVPGGGLPPEYFQAAIDLELQRAR